MKRRNYTANSDRARLAYAIASGLTLPTGRYYLWYLYKLAERTPNAGDIKDLRKKVREILQEHDGIRHGTALFSVEYLGDTLYCITLRKE